MNLSASATTRGPDAPSLAVGSCRGVHLLPALALLAFSACSPGSPAALQLSPSPSPRLEAVSNRPDRVSGGDVLVRVAGADAEQLRLEVDRVAVQPRIGEGTDGSLLALFEGLDEGERLLVATTPAGSDTMRLTVWPITGPIISGPHQQPFICQTEMFELVTGDLLGAPLDTDCSVPTRIDYVYHSSSEGPFRPFPVNGPRPTDISNVTTLDGVTVPFIVRVETGTINRAVYESAILHDPAEPVPDPWTRSRGWNGKLVYTHGGGCRAGWHIQGARTGGVLHEGLLEMGYATTSSTLNVFGNNCNDLLASETHIMVKERFVERYGPPIYTIGTGGSGGAYQSHQTADNYPGVFDGIIVSASFPDVLATSSVAADGRLLHRYFTRTAPGAFSREQQLAVSGFGVWESIGEMSRAATRLDPTYDPDAPPEEQGGEVRLEELNALRYSPRNPTGVRATVHDHTINVYGVDGETGFAGRPLDNHGVQYGLEALRDGVITAAQFIALNRDIGGFDADLDHAPARHRASPLAARRAIDTGRILNGGGGLATTPTIDYRQYQDHAENGDVHMIVHQHATRARLIAASGHAENQVMVVGGRWGFSEESPDLRNLFAAMDRWLMSIRADSSAIPEAERVGRTRPAELVEGCWEDDGPDRQFHAETLSAIGEGRCAALYPVYSTPRQVAGGPLANNIVSCQLKPVDPADYPADLTDEHLAELRAIFPDGVCDWGAGDAHSRGYEGDWSVGGVMPSVR